MSTRKIGRNEPCPCGSGKKFKKCCIKDSIDNLGGFQLIENNRNIIVYGAKFDLSGDHGWPQVCLKTWKCLMVHRSSSSSNKTCYHGIGKNLLFRLSEVAKWVEQLKAA